MNNEILLKVITWRMVSILITLLTLYVITGDIKSSSGITIALHTLLTASHYIFEKTWQSLTSKPEA